MQFGHVGFAQPGELTRFSPAIWGDCPGDELNALGDGFYREVRFAGAPTGTLAAALDATMVSFGDGALKLDADTDTVLAMVSDRRYGALSIETDADDNDAAALYSQPFCRITKNSGQRVWLEAIVASGDVDADMGIFFGLVEADALDGTTSTARDVLSDDVAADALVAESLIGFILDNGDDNAFDAVYRKDNGTVTSILADVTASDRIEDSDLKGSLADGTFVKLGLIFDGRETISIFSQGYKVATLTVDTTFDQTHDLGVVLGVKTGTTAAEQVHTAGIRFAFQER